jgi:hypothetical protein
MSDSQRRDASTRRPSRWDPVTQLEPHPDVILGFHGLMCLCHHGNGHCEVGVVNTDPGKHDLRIFIAEVSSGFNPPTDIELGTITPRRLIKVSETGHAHTDIVTIDAFRPRISGVRFFQPAGAPKVDPSDFRHIVDLEGTCFYDGEKTGKARDYFGPRLRVRDAVFYTLCRTAREFKSKEEGAADACPVGSVARVVGANIYLKSGRPTANVTVKVNGAVKETLEVSADKKYLVFIDNSCPKCDPKVSDFPQYYTAVTPPGAKKKILLEKTGGMGSAPRNGPCAPDFVKMLERLFGTFSEKDLEEFNIITDDAPCGPTGAGTSGDLDT